MNKSLLLDAVYQITLDSPLNFISAETALSESSAAMKIFDEPLFAAASADDELFQKYKNADIIGSHFIAPSGWLDGAKTVLSFFWPYTKEIKTSNAADFNWPSDNWLHGRFEGQQFINNTLTALNDLLKTAGYSSVIPVFEKNFKGGVIGDQYFSSNWSERHAAFAAGLGTFGLSKGLITKKGICGRFGSIITDLALPVDQRDYKEVYEYCIMCGACVKHCPVSAISIETGKKHAPCSAFLDKTYANHAPRYGCGKCQVRVPCESAVPKSPKSKKIPL